MSGTPNGSREVVDRVRTFLVNEVILDDSVELTDDTPLLSGLLDSMGLTHLVTFLEDDFGIKLEYSDVEPGNFRTIGDIARLVTERS